MRKFPVAIAAALILTSLSGCRSWFGARPDDAGATLPEQATPAVAAPARAPVERPVTEVPADGSAPEFPASYAGEVPCADCRALDYRLNLFGDGVYYLRETYRGRANGDETYDDIGRWRRDGGEGFRLDGGGAQALAFARAGDGGLSLLGADGQPVAGAALARDAAFAAIEPSLPLRGMASRKDGRLSLRECSTGRQLPVLDEGDAAALQAAVAEGDAPVLATFRGRLLRRALVPGDVLDDAVLVERFRKTWPGEGCGPRYADAPLEGTSWRLLELAGERVPLSANEAGAVITLDKDSGRLQGSTGCNKVSADYTWGEGQLRIGVGVSTRMACPAAAMVRESAFLGLFEKVAAARVNGQRLDWLDAEGQVLASFDAVPD